MARVLIIDDDEGMSYTLSSMVCEYGHQAESAHNLKEGLNKAISEPFDVVFLDVIMPDGNGLTLLPEILKTPSKPEVIIITGSGDPDGAEIAIRTGAWDYLQKPFSRQEMLLPLQRALQYREVQRKKKPSLLLKRDNLVGESTSFRRCLDLAGTAAQSDTSVLITGETGTGKELVALAIHNNSSRRSKSFVIVDCATLPGTLVESVLFGHEKGAFTNADRAHEGLVLQANGGTLFLDEVGELPLSVQKAFLRVLQERRFRPVGGQKELQSDFRLITATNRDLSQMVDEGTFRQDLLYRIGSLVINLPPLRERRKDIRELAMHFMNRFCKRYKMEPKGFSPELIEGLTTYNWPGNVRELENCMNSLLTTAGDDPTLFSKHLPLSIRVQVTRDSVRKEETPLPEPKTDQGQSSILTKFKDYREKGLAEIEQIYLRDLLSLAQGQIKEACRISGLSQSRLYALLKKHQVKGFPN
jgi:two-component system NtrC family response regulator